MVRLIRRLKQTIKHHYQVCVKATCFTRQITFENGHVINGPEYTGDFLCSNFNCPGCGHRLINGQPITGFPFQLTQELGRGGFARVARGKFHQGEAAFKDATQPVCSLRVLF